MLKKFLFIIIFVLAIFLRFSQITTNPPSLYWEEAALGYDAYSILKTGRDHHGNPFPIVAFESFGDWKPAGYFYTIIPFIQVFGLSELAVRFPSFVAGLFIVVGIAYIARILKTSPIIALAVAAISPWAIQFSRSAWESNLATALVIWGVIFGIRSVEKEKIKLLDLLVSAVLFIFSMYTYHSARITAPLLLIGLIGLYFSKHHEKNIFLFLLKVIKINWQTLSITLVISLSLLFPLLSVISSPVFKQRFAETSIFSDLTIIEKSNLLKDNANNTIFARLLYHRYLLFTEKIIINFLSHFDLQFLFLSGDSNPRHSIQFFGELYHFDAIFLIIGFFVWAKKRTSTHIFFLGWLGVAILPSSLTTATPHSLRALAAMPVFLLLVTEGIVYSITYFQEFLIKNKKFFSYLSLRFAILIPILIIVAVYSVEVVGYWRYYTTIYPVIAAHEWQYGYKEMVTAVSDLVKKDPSVPIYISREEGRPAMYFWFYSKTDPREVQQENLLVKKDQGEFLSFKNYYFIRSIHEIKGSGYLAANSTFIENNNSNLATKIRDISLPNGQIVWSIYKLN